MDKSTEVRNHRKTNKSKQRNVKAVFRIKIRMYYTIVLAQYIASYQISWY